MTPVSEHPHTVPPLTAHPGPPADSHAGRRLDQLERTEIEHRIARTSSGQAWLDRVDRITRP